MNNLDLMKKRLNFLGGYTQEERLIKGKLIGMQKATSLSYQAAEISLVQKYSESLPFNANILIEQPCFPCLINPNKLLNTYDEKMLSIEYKYGFSIGDIVKWGETNTYWILYKEYLTQDAYLYCSIRRCKHKINFINEKNEKRTTWVSIIGPQEKNIENSTNNALTLDSPNYLLELIVPANDDTKVLFQRYGEFLFQEKNWMVQAVNSINEDNVLLVYAKEYYIDKETDNIKDNIKNDFIIEEESNTFIEGNSVIKATIEEIYHSPEEGGIWSVPENIPVKITYIDDTSIKLVWTKAISGSFVLTWAKNSESYNKKITVDSLF